MNETKNPYWILYEQKKKEKHKRKEEKRKWLGEHEHLEGTCWNCFLNEQVDIDLMEIFIAPSEQLPERVIVQLTGTETDVIMVKTKKFFCKNCFQEIYGFEYFLEKNGKYTKIV